MILRLQPVRELSLSINACEQELIPVRAVYALWVEPPKNVVDLSFSAPAVCTVAPLLFTAWSSTLKTLAFADMTLSTLEMAQFVELSVNLCALESFAWDNMRSTETTPANVLARDAVRAVLSAPSPRLARIAVRRCHEFDDTRVVGKFAIDIAELHNERLLALDWSGNHHPTDMRRKRFAMWQLEPALPFLTELRGVRCTEPADLRHFMLTVLPLARNLRYVDMECFTASAAYDADPLLLALIHACQHSGVELQLRVYTIR
jgi:hypothetical protein